MSLLSNLKRSAGMFVTCPNCDAQFSLSRAQLFDATAKVFPAPAMDYLATKYEELEGARRHLKRRKTLVDRSRVVAKAVNIGQVIEVIAPSLPGFPVAAADCRALFKPIDYVAFRGLTQKESIDSVVFIDVKSGRGRLSDTQSQVKKLVECGKVKLIVAPKPGVR